MINGIISISCNEYAFIKFCLSHFNFLFQIKIISFVQLNIEYVPYNEPFLHQKSVCSILSIIPLAFTLIISAFLSLNMLFFFRHFITNLIISMISKHRLAPSFGKKILKLSPHHPSLLSL